MEPWALSRLVSVRSLKLEFFVGPAPEPPPEPAPDPPEPAPEPPPKPAPKPAPGLGPAPKSILWLETPKALLLGDEPKEPIQTEEARPNRSNGQTSSNTLALREE